MSQPETNTTIRKAFRNLVFRACKKDSNIPPAVRQAIIRYRKKQLNKTYKSVFR